MSAPVTTGFWLSVMVTVCVHVANREAVSVTFQVTVVVPSGNWAGASLLSTGPHVPVVVGIPRLTCARAVVQTPESVKAETFTGQMMVGVPPPVSVHTPLSHA